MQLTDLAPNRWAFSVKEVAEMLGCSEQTVYASIKQGLMPSVWISKRRVVIPRSIFELMDSWLPKSNYQTP